jgi:hypothetical protein
MTNRRRISIVTGRVIMHCVSDRTKGRPSNGLINNNYQPRLNARDGMILPGLNPSDLHQLK